MSDKKVTISKKQAIFIGALILVMAMVLLLL